MEAAEVNQLQQVTRSHFFIAIRPRWHPKCAFDESLP